MPLTVRRSSRLFCPLLTGMHSTGGESTFGGLWGLWGVASSSRDRLPTVCHGKGRGLTNMPLQQKALSL
jgi:hypothetical protein